MTSSTLRLHQVPVAKLYKSKFVFRWRFRYWKETTSNSLKKLHCGNTMLVCVLFEGDIPRNKNIFPQMKSHHVFKNYEIFFSWWMYSAEQCYVETYFILETLSEEFYKRRNSFWKAIEGDYYMYSFFFFVENRKLNTTPCWPRLKSNTTVVPTLTWVLLAVDTSASAPCPSPTLEILISSVPPVKTNCREQFKKLLFIR